MTTNKGISPAYRSISTKSVELDQISRNDDKTRQRNCDLCHACEDLQNASGFCKSCQQYLCDECRTQHGFIPAQKNHTFLSVEEGILLQNKKKPMYCGLCQEVSKVSEATKLCIECRNLLLCERCSRKHSASTTTSFHNLTEDLTLHIENNENNTELSHSGLFDEGTGGVSANDDPAEKERQCSVIKPETEYYIRFILLLIKGGSSILRHVVFCALERKQTSLCNFLTSQRTEIFKSKHIKWRQIKILYPDPPTNSDIKKWDIQLLCFIILEYFDNKLNTPEKTAVKKIREMRNDFHAHYPSACIDRSTFYTLWSELSLIMTTLGHNMTDADREENNKLISILCSTKLDMNSATEEIKRFDNSDEFLENIQQSLKDVLGMNVFVKQDLSEIKAALTEIQMTLSTEGKHEKVVNTVYGAVHVRAKKQSIVEKAEAKLLDASKKSKSELGTSTKRELTEKFDKFKDEVEETGVKVEDNVDKGSIIFTFKSHSTSELLKLINLFESPQMQMRMDDISQSLKNIIGENIQLTAYILRDSLLEVLRQMKTEHKRTILLNMTCTGIEGLQHALKMFEEEGASNSLNELSKFLTDSIGETVTLETSIDMDQLQRAIIVTRQQLASSVYSKGSLLMSEYSSESGLEKVCSSHLVTESQNVDTSELWQAENISRAGKNVKTGVKEKRDNSRESSNDVCSQQINPEEERTRSGYHNETAEKEKRPGKPVALDISSDTVILSWDKPMEFGKDDYYQIYITADLDDHKCKWRKCPAEPKSPTVTITELKTNTIFIFRVRAIYANEDGPYSPRSDRIKTTMSLGFRLLKNATKLEDVKSFPGKYMLPMTEIESSRNESNKTKKYEIGASPKGYVMSKTILLVGATGTGKSTLVDGIANYALAVNWEDNFRFTVLTLEEHEKARVKNQALSQTDWITCYTINHDTGSRLKYQLNVIDTPGFGDTAGPIRDQQIADQLRILFKAKEPEGVTYIDAACFLIKAPDARLTVFQDYIFKSVMALFGKDMERNICYLITFADNKTPPVLSAMKESGLPEGETFIFNNSGLFETNVSNDATNAAPLFWKMGSQSFNSFFEYLGRMQSRSLQQTRDVLDERNLLEETVSQLQPLLDLGLSKLSGLKQEIEILEENRSTIKDNQNFEYEVEELRGEKRALPVGQQATTCSQCNYTCHDSCNYSDDNLKLGCCAFDLEGNCKVCPGKCSCNDHENTAYTINYVPVKVKKHYQNMRRKFDEASDKVWSQEQVIEGLQQELEQHTKEIEYCMFVVKSCTDKLSHIALRPNPLNMTDYIDLMIENEKYEKKEGFQRRIAVLKELRKKAGIQNDFDKFIEEKKDILYTFGRKRSDLLRSVVERTRTWIS